MIALNHLQWRGAAWHTAAPFYIPFGLGRMIDLSTLTLDSFAPHVGTPFALNHPEQQETFTLVQASAGNAHDHPMKKRDPFSLFFHGSRTDLMFNQQILPLKHEAMGELEIFVVPIGRNDDGTIRYQAVFS